MFTYGEDSAMIPTVLEFYKENNNEHFDKKFSDKTCDKVSSSNTKETVIGLKRQQKSTSLPYMAMFMAIGFVIVYQATSMQN